MVGVRFGNPTRTLFSDVLGKLEPPPNEKFPRNSPFGGGSAGPPPNGKFPGNFPFDFRKKV